MRKCLYLIINGGVIDFSGRLGARRAAKCMAQDLIPIDKAGLAYRPTASKADDVPNAVRVICRLSFGSPFLVDRLKSWIVQS
jgi:hypothetical protein